MALSVAFNEEQIRWKGGNDGRRIHARGTVWSIGRKCLSFGSIQLENDGKEKIEPFLYERDRFAWHDVKSQIMTRAKT